MKKIAILIIIFILFVGIYLGLDNKKDIIKTSANVDIEEDFKDWKAKYIALENNDGNNKENEWLCFRKNFNISNEKDIKNAVCRIAVDSKYWLYINGEIVVREGGLKRGEIGNSIYYDKVDIEKYLKMGENNISILVWHFGKSSFSHVDSGQGTLLLQAEIGENTIISDDTWKVKRNDAYLNINSNTNTRLSESDIYYDANLELGDWYKNQYNDLEWTRSNYFR